MGGSSLLSSSCASFGFETIELQTETVGNGVNLFTWINGTHVKDWVKWTRTRSMQRWSTNFNSTESSEFNCTVWVKLQLNSAWKQLQLSRSKSQRQSTFLPCESKRIISDSRCAVASRWYLWSGFPVRHVAFHTNVVILLTFLIFTADMSSYALDIYSLHFHRDHRD